MPSSVHSAAREGVTGVGPRVRLLGIRHHGPGSARAVAASLAAAPPDVVLIECPADADGVIALVEDPGMEPPVALLAHVVDRPERAAFFPFASFSPEWVAMRWALERGVPVRCIDLPARTMLAVRTGDADRALTTDERPVDPIAELAAAAGYDDAERWWEDVVEHQDHPDGASDPDAPFLAVGEAMAAVRAAVEPLGEPPDELERWREAHLRSGIRRALADGFTDVVVVCGAWHVPALGGASDAGQARRDAATLRGLPRAKVALTWVPWTHRRLASRLGYGAGVTAPGWYHHLHRHAGPDVIARWFAEVARVLRDADYPVSAADVVEATRLAQALAVVRDRPLAGLTEVDDAARAALGAGGDAPMRLISNDLVVGTHIGSVPASTPVVPLARSLAAEQRRCRLKPTSDERLVELDLRTALDRSRSQLLHRVAILGVPWGRVVEGRGSTGTFRETWTLRWEPELEVRIIEVAALGTTLSSAAQAALVQRAVGPSSIAELSALVEAALLAGLDDVVAQLLERLSAEAALTAEVLRLMDAVPVLVRTIRYGDVRATDASQLRAVVVAMMVRVTAGLVPVCSALDDDAASAVADQIAQVQSALSLLADERLADSWHRALADLVERQRVHGLVQGLATRVLADTGRLAGDELERRVARGLSPAVAPADAAAFVEGFVGGSGAVLVHDTTLRGAVDRWVCSLSAEAFTGVLPLLRRTFGAFPPAERRALGERLRRGEHDRSASAAALDAARAAAALDTLALLLGRPR